MNNFSNKIYPSITGRTDEDWKNKFKEIKELEIKEIPLFLEEFSSSQRIKIYKALEKTPIESIPLVHIRHDMINDELKLLVDKYDSKYLTIHEDGFNYINEWKGFEDKLFLEMSTDDVVAENVKVEEIGGFCVDLAHYIKQKERGTIDYDYVYNRRDNKSLFRCNHLSGYSFEGMDDIHLVNSKQAFNYLKDLPEFVFGDFIAIEVDNSIKEQLKFKKYISKLLAN
ncbi:MAG: hypothetical protein ACQEP3_01715 [Patescibacteria group bacterium]